MFMFIFKILSLKFSVIITYNQAIWFKEGFNSSIQIWSFICREMKN